MPDQTPINRINGRYQPVPPASSHASPDHGPGVGRLLADVTELAELQVRLLTADVGEIRQRIGAPVIALAIGLAIVLGAIPVLLLAVAAVLQSQMGWEQWLAYLVTGGAGALVGLVALGLAYAGFQRITAPLERSSTELAKSIASLRQMFTKSGTATSAHKQHTSDS